MQKPMLLAIEKARENMMKGIGGPFGAAIVGPDGELLAVTSNQVIADQDPTAHAEVVAIREATRKLGNRDLSGCTIYATGYPCPMCLGAIIWANIKNCYFGNAPEDANEIGFRDDFIYDFIRGGMTDKDVLEIKRCNKEECIKLFEEYAANKKEIY